MSGRNSNRRRMNKSKLAAMKIKLEESVAKLKADKEDYKKKTAEHARMQGRHNGQRRVKACLRNLETGKYGLTLDELVDCYWEEILEYMLSVRVRFVLPGPHSGFDERIVAEQRNVFEMVLNEHGLSLVNFFDLHRCAIQTILLKRGCVKRRVFASIVNAAAGAEAAEAENSE